MLLFATLLLASTMRSPMPMPPPARVSVNHVIEFVAESGRERIDPFNEIDVDAVVRSADGKEWTVPAFWAGGKSWKARFASPKPGRFSYRFKSTDPADSTLGGVHGDFEVTPYSGKSPLYKHGPARVAADRRHFEHTDGTPFFWLGDTWWMGLCQRLTWPDEFQTLLKDRVKKGYSVVQIVAGLYPDMPPFDSRGANEAGFPWTEDYGRIRPEYFDMADRRIRAMVDAGISPCIVGAWGYFIPWMGPEKLSKHWRYLVARYAAYPVFWCVAGEANLPWYLAKGFPYDDREQVREWTKVARSLRADDPFHRPISIHPTGLGHLDARNAIDDVALLDFDMLQTGHGDRGSLQPTVDASRMAYAGKPVMPWLNSEVCYEGILGACHDDVQRLMFWTSMLNGAAGHTYGANGIWQLNQPGKPYGKSPHGGDYGPVPWTEAMNLPGSGQLGKAKEFLQGLKWQTLTPLPDFAVYAADMVTPVWGDWIWYPEGNPAEDAPVAPRWFRRAFEARRGVRATLRVAADDRHAAYLNGTKVSEGAGWSSVREVDVTSLVHEGTNVLAVRAENMKAPVAKNPAGLLCSLTLGYPAGRVEHIVTDSSWKAQNREELGWERTGHDDSAWAAARSAAKYGSGPWGIVSTDDSSPYLAPYAATMADGSRIVYVPLPHDIKLTGNPPNRSCRWEALNPATFERVMTGTLKGRGPIHAPRGTADWLLVLRPE